MLPIAQNSADPSFDAFQLSSIFHNHIASLKQTTWGKNPGQLQKHVFSFVLK